MSPATSPASLQALLDAFALPPGALVQQRIAKKLLAEQGAPTAADKRVIVEAIDDLTWHAVLKPGTVSVAATPEGVLPAVTEIVLLALRLKPGTRDAQARRVVELVHRAIPYPLLLATHSAAGTALSLAPKRLSQAEAARWVLAEPVTTTHAFDAAQPAPAEAAFLASLPLHTLPHADLSALYAGVADRITALAVAQLTDRFAPAPDAAAAQARREALAEHVRLAQALAAARRSAAGARQLARRVEHNLQAQRLQQALQDIHRRLDA